MIVTMGREEPANYVPHDKLGRDSQRRLSSLPRIPLFDTCFLLVHYLASLWTKKVKARGSVNGRRTMLQAGTSRVRNPDEANDFFSICLILPATLGPRGLLNL
jgi:hypothetical protein